jgi:transposase
MMLAEAGEINLCYGDESGFSLKPTIPYGWQPPGEYVRITPSTCKRLNVFGIMTTDNELEAYISENSINSKMIISMLDDFAKTITKTTVLILDNASIHTSIEFKSKRLVWKRLGLRIFYLPKYSPHLNFIETLWRKFKYSWLKPSDYTSIDALKSAIENIVKSFGKELKIKFSELKYFTEYKSGKKSII